MVRRIAHKPSLAVVGLGDYFWKLRRGLLKYFNPVALIDSNPSVKQKLAQPEKSLFRSCSRAEDLAEAIGSAANVVILTPNHLHVPYALEAIKAGRATVIEKPIATSLSDLEQLDKEIRRGAPVYCSDFYVDVRAVPLLGSMGRLETGDWRLGLIRGGSTKASFPVDIGEITRIEACIAEDYPFRFDSWLGGSHAGGVIFDLMIHLFALTNRLFPGESLMISNCAKLYANARGSKSLFSEKPLSPESGEAFARVEGRLMPSGVPVSFETLKNAPKTDRYFAVTGSKGKITQLFRPGHRLRGVVDGQTLGLSIRGDRYDLACHAMRRWFDSGASSYGWSWNSWAVQQAIAAREWCVEPEKSQATEVSRPSLAKSHLVARGWKHD
jgi:predicted dehydrogenase